jgi:hypothetical protein
MSLNAHQQVDVQLGLLADGSFDCYKYVVEKMMTMTGDMHSTSPSALVGMLWRQALVIKLACNNRDNSCMDK